MGPRLCRRARNAYGSAGEALGRAADLRGSRPSSPRKRHQHRKARRGRRPSFGRHSAAKLPRLSMKILRRLGLLLLLVILAGGYLLWRLVWPYQGFQGETFVDVPHGTSTQGIADL